jgi:hypothetical protein
MVRAALHIGYRACNHSLTCPLGQVAGPAHLVVRGKERRVTALRLFELGLKSRKKRQDFVRTSNVVFRLALRRKPHPNRDLIM